MNPVGADVGRKFDFAHYDRFFREAAQPANLIFNWHGLRHRRSHPHATDSRLGRWLTALLENVPEHVADFGRIGALELDELAHHLYRSHVKLCNHAGELPNHVCILRHQEARRFRQGQNVNRA